MILRLLRVFTVHAIITYFLRPTFEGLRVANRHLFSSHVAYDMAAFMQQKDQSAVLRHILACLREVNELNDVDHSRDVDVGIHEQPDTYDSE